ncbi:MAG: M15 family metallopeptidase [Rickettsiales bacterium]|nr:M15 family metallopeptidase [Rickettsiales bacterium]
MKRPWSDFAQARSTSFVRDQLADAQAAQPHLVALGEYRKAERIQACGGIDPLRTMVAYAQDEWIYDEQDRFTRCDDASYYQTLPREKRLNKFGLAYRRDARLWQHRILADIMVGAAIHLYQTQGWRTVVYDGLRTMEGAYKLYQFAPDSDIQAGLLALPGQSAHNKGLAVDSMMEDAQGREIDMGGHFDHLDMETNSRTYAGQAISPMAKYNRLIREAAFLRSAFSQGLLVAPLRSEFWDDRLPENREDLWRVLDSAARVVGIDLLSADDLALRKTNRDAFANKYERWSYADFINRWKATFAGREAELIQQLGTALPPLNEKPDFYHGNYHPIFDHELVATNQHLTAL